MTSVTDELRLAADFAPATYDGLKIEPIYQRARRAAPIAGRPAAAPWQIMQRIDHPDATSANAQALHDLENGVNGLTLVFAGANGAYGFGLEPTAEAIEKILDGIPDPTGQVYRFNLAGSLLKASKSAWEKG